MEGESELEKIYFNKEDDWADGTKAPETEYFLDTDLVICANGIENPKRNLLQLVGNQENGSERKINAGSLKKPIPHANVRFSLIHNDVDSPILGVGSAIEIPSFIFKRR